MDAGETASLILPTLYWSMSNEFKTGGDSNDNEGDDNNGGGGSGGGGSDPASCESSNLLIN